MHFISQVHQPHEPVRPPRADINNSAEAAPVFDPMGNEPCGGAEGLLAAELD